MVLKKIRSLLEPYNVESWYKKYENRISFFALILGFTIDSLTLSTVDALMDQIILAFYITVSGLCIILLSAYENKRLQEKVEGRARFWLTFVMQFALGGLFSAFVIFYSKGSSLEISWPFLVILAIYFLGNEVYKKHYREFSFRLGVYFFALLSYFTIITPTLLKSIDQWVFIVSSITSVFVFLAFIYVISLFSKDVNRSKKFLITYSFSVLTLANLFYILNIIPPLPLLLKDSGVYHNLIVKGDGGYILNVENSNKWKDFLGSKKIFHRYGSEPVYVLTAVYSPIDLDINITHNWQKFDFVSNNWLTESNVKVPIQGGRHDGYRLYSFKRNVTPGLWRVNVLTADGRIIGRVKFEIENTDYPYQTMIINK